MHKLHKYTLPCSAIAVIFAAAPNIGAAADTELPPVIVSAAANGAQPVVSNPQPTPKSSVTRAGIELLGGPAQSSVYLPINLMPSVIVESPDAYGLSPTRNINIRGKGDFHVTRNVEGLPLAGIVGGADMLDLENVAQVDVYRGGLAADQGLGMSNATGAVNQRQLGPRDQFGVTGKQAVGDLDFRRTFVRVDSGALAGGATKVFVSGSTTVADKWTGVGDESRRNLMLGLSQQAGERVKVDVDLIYNKFKGNTYRAWTYVQTLALEDNYKYDFNPALSGKAASDVNYYNFNRVEYENYAALANVDITLADAQHLVFKPYYWKDNGVQYSASGANVQLWRQQNDNAGAVLEYRGRYGAGTELVAGYWLQSMAPPPPPTDQTKYTVTAGGGLAFAGWATLARIDNFIANSPYFQLKQSFGNTLLSAGVRYMDLGAPKMQYYKTANLPNVSYDDAWAYNPAADTRAAVTATHYRELLPNIGIEHAVSPAWRVGASVGRKFGRPDWGPQASNYISNETAFAAKGVSLQALIDRVRPELSDQLDLSVHYESDGLSLASTVFAARNRNRQVLVSDAALGGLSYYQGSAKTAAYGLELEAGYQIDQAWSVFGSATLAAETYDGNAATLAGGSALATDGKQIPNAARRMLKGGLSYRWSDLVLSPLARYVGQRFGDSVEAQPVGSYTVVDFNASYQVARDMRLGLTVQNLFDRKYVSQISPNDTNLNGATAYYAGAPRTVAMTLDAKF